MIYPKDLVKELKDLWPKSKEYKADDIPSLPNDNILNEILECVYHSSFLTEESRRLSVRIIFTNYKELSDTSKEFPSFNNKSLLRFDNPRPFRKSELLRLAPATDPEKMLICVNCNSQNKLQIWGIYDIGSSWWKFIHGESSKGSLPPNNLTISTSNPGNITISRRGRIILNLSCGKINKPLLGIFQNGPIGDFFNPSQKNFYKEICNELNIKKWDEDGRDDNYPFRKYVDFIERIIFNIKRIHHGGTLIIVPDKIKNIDLRIKDRINIKYKCDFFKVWDLLKDELKYHHKYYKLHFQLWDSKTNINVNDFQKCSILDSDYLETEEAINDNVKFISSLSKIDGAVVITDKFRLLGFGGEVIINSPYLNNISVSKDSHGENLIEIPIESYGTRHRSAFRFCSSFEEAIAIIVSQDGGVKAVKRHEDKLILWPDINEGYFGI